MSQLAKALRPVIDTGIHGVWRLDRERSMSAPRARSCCPSVVEVEQLAGEMKERR